MIEWQANHIAPRILMPAKTFSIKAKESCEKKNYITGSSDPSELNDIAAELADFFQVSRQSALIRLQDIGYTEAALLNDNRYGTAENTFTISTPAAYALYNNDPVFRELINKNLFCRSEGIYVINNDKYIEERNGQPRLTAYAREHLDECALVFKAYRPVMALRPDQSRDHFKRGYTESAHYNDDDNASVLERAKKLYSQMQAFHAEEKTFWEAANEYMAKQHWNRSSFVDNTGLLPNLYSVGHSNPGQAVAFQTAISICAGLQLDYQSSMALLGLAGFTLNGTNQLPYQFILSDFRFESLENKNAFLIEHGLPPLGSGTYKNK